MPETKCREGFDNNINMLPIITPLLLHLVYVEKKKFNPKYYVEI